MNRQVSLHQLSLRDVGPVDLAQLAPEAGFSSISVFLYPPAPQLDIFPRLEPGPVLQAFKRELNASAVRVHNIEALPFSGRTDPAYFLPVLDMAADIGASRATVLIYDRDLARASNRLSQTCSAAAERGVAISIEFMGFSTLKTVEEAAQFVQQNGHENLSLLVDPLHLARTGGTVQDLKPLARSVGALQFCDAPVDAPEDQFSEAVEDRGIPGEGDLPLQDLLDATAPELPLDVEVPMRRLKNQGVSPLERARRLKASLAQYRY